MSVVTGCLGGLVQESGDDFCVAVIGGTTFWFWSGLCSTVTRSLAQAIERRIPKSRAKPPPTLIPHPLHPSPTKTHLLLPTIHRLLILLMRLEEQQINHIQILDMSVLFKVCSFFGADHGGGDVECVEGADFWCLRGESCKWRKGREGRKKGKRELTDRYQSR
jgi:hypothetical protein